MSNQDTQIINEMYFKELISSIWANKLIVLITLIFFISLGFFDLSRSKSEYTANALFELDSREKESNFPSNLDSIMSISGITNGKNSSLQKLKERIMARVFIEKIDRQFGLRADSYFNIFDPLAREPIWKIKLKDFIGFQNLPRDTEEIVWHSVIEGYRKNVVFELSFNN